MVRPGNQKRIAPEIKQVLRKNPNQIFTVLPMDKGLGHGSWTHGITSQKHKGPQPAHSLDGMGICRCGSILSNHCTQLRESLLTGRIWEDGGAKSAQMSEGNWPKCMGIAWSLDSCIPDSNHGSTTYATFRKLFYLPESLSTHI